MKRTFDIIVSLIVLILLTPLLLLIAVLIKLDSKGDVFFFQERVGRDCQTFGIYKFRSMVAMRNNKVRILRHKMIRGLPKSEPSCARRASMNCHNLLTCSRAI